MRHTSGDTPRETGLERQASGGAVGDKEIAMKNETTIEQQLEKHQILPVIALENEGSASPLAEALVSGGLPVAEITFRTAAAESAIRTMASRGDLLVGAGTVLTVEQASLAQDAGAQFAVSPGFNTKVVRHCQKIKLPIFPGVSTPTEIEMALDHGLHTVKFFPAEVFGGLKALQAISAPYPMMRFIPTGGINSKNLAAYLGFPSVLACGGSWMVRPELYADGDFTSVQLAVHEAKKHLQAEL